MGIASGEVLESLPQKEPFLFVDEVVELNIESEKKSILTSYKVVGDEYFFKGHFPENPIMPGVLLQEALFQSGALLMSKLGSEGLGVVARVDNVKFKNFVRPGDTLHMEVVLDDVMDAAFYMRGKIRVLGKVVASLKFTGARV